MHLFDLLTKTAREYPDSESFIDSDSRCTFAQMHETTLAFAAYLHDKGIRPGMHVALLCRNGIPFVNAVFALLRLGAVCVPLNWRLTRKELSSQIEHADAAYLLYDKNCKLTSFSTL